MSNKNWGLSANRNFYDRFELLWFYFCSPYQWFTCINILTIIFLFEMFEKMEGVGKSISKVSMASWKRRKPRTCTIYEIWRKFMIIRLSWIVTINCKCMDQKMYTYFRFVKLVKFANRTILIQLRKEQRKLVKTYKYWIYNACAVFYRQVLPVLVAMWIVFLCWK